MMKSVVRGSPDMLKRGCLLIAASLAVATGLLQSTAASAAAADDVIIHSEPGVTVTVPDPAQKVKPDAEAPMQTLAGAYCPYDRTDCRFSLNPRQSRTVTPSGGSSGALTSSGSVNVVMYTVPFVAHTKADYYSTSSYSNWGGTRPWNCTSIKHADRWDIDYAAASWSFGGGVPSGSVNLGSGTLQYENTVNNTFRVDHSVAHIYLAVTGGTIRTVKYEVHGSYQFGSQFFTTDGYASDFLLG